MRKTKRGQPKIITFRDFKRFNETDFLNDITHIPLSIIECCDSMDSAWTVFRDQFLSVCDVHANIKQRKVRGHDIPWMTCDIRETMQHETEQRNTLWIMKLVLFQSRQQTVLTIFLRE